MEADIPFYRQGAFMHIDDHPRWDAVLDKDVTGIVIRLARKQIGTFDRLCFRWQCFPRWIAALTAVT